MLEYVAERANAAAGRYGRFRQLYTMFRVLGEPKSGPTSSVVSWGYRERIEILICDMIMGKMVGYRSGKWLKGPSPPLQVMVVFNG